MLMKLGIKNGAAYLRCCWAPNPNFNMDAVDNVN